MDFDRLINMPIVRCEVHGCVIPGLMAARKGTSRVATKFVRTRDKMFAVCDEHTFVAGQYEFLSYDDGIGEWIAQGVMER